MTNYLRKITLSLSHMKNIVAVALLAAVTIVSFPVQSVNADAEEVFGLSAASADSGTKSEYSFSVPSYTKVTVLRTYEYVPMTAYTSRPEETDDTPFITADGSHVRDGIVAANFLPFGTKIRIPALYGDKIFEVHDRMNKRYPYKVDVWMEDYNEAIQFGVRYAQIEIVEVEEFNK